MRHKVDLPGDRPLKDKKPLVGNSRSRNYFGYGHDAKRHVRQVLHVVRLALISIPNMELKG